MRILTICPSIRNSNIMKESFLNTISEDNKLIIDDNLGVTNTINDCFNINPDYDFYHITNDDVIYKTKGWDNKLANKGKISYGNDLIQGENLCTFPMIDGDIVRALGWLQLPTLNHYCGDVVWRTIGKSLNILNYVSEVIIKHEFNFKIKEEIHKKDMNSFAEWLRISYKDILKVKEALNG